MNEGCECREDVRQLPEHDIHDSTPRAIRLRPRSLQQGAKRGEVANAMRNVYVTWHAHCQSAPKSSSAQIQRTSLPKWFLPVRRRRTKRKSPLKRVPTAKLRVACLAFRSELFSRRSTTSHERSLLPLHLLLLGLFLFRLVLSRVVLLIQNPQQ